MHVETGRQGGRAYDATDEANQRRHGQAVKNEKNLCCGCRMPKTVVILCFSLACLLDNAHAIAIYNRLYHELIV